MNDNIGNNINYNPSTKAEIDKLLRELPAEIEEQALKVNEARTLWENALDIYKFKCDTYINNINNIDVEKIERETKLLIQKKNDAYSKFQTEKTKLIGLNNRLKATIARSSMGGLK